MKAPRSTLPFIFIGGAITSCAERLLSGALGDFAACFISMLCLVFYCEIAARILQIPVTVILMPSTIPLLPGSSIYYAMYYAVQADSALFLSYARSTLYAGTGIALGEIIGSTAVKIFRLYKKQ